MCTVSNIGTEFGRTFPERWPRWVPETLPPQPLKPIDLAKLLNPPTNVTREEFDGLKAELESLKKLLAAAKQYDTETGQKDCEEADKIALFKKLAEIVGVDLSEVFAK